MTTLVWLRHDLRLRDNPALFHAAEKGHITPVFIYDPDAMDRDYGAASKVWLHHALTSLQHDLKNKGIDLIVRQGDSANILNDLIQETSATSVYWNRGYEAWSIDRDTAIKSTLQERGIDAQSFKANLLFEPWEVKNGAGDPYRVFTPYWKACLQQADIIDSPLSIPKMTSNDTAIDSLQVDELTLLPSSLDWDEGMVKHWDISEDGAWAQLNHFFENGLRHYKDGRDCPSHDHTSKLSPYLRWGMISPRAIWQETQIYAHAHDVPQAQSDFFLREIGWREFSFHLLYHYPDMKSRPLQEKFEKFPWIYDADILQKWQRGQTGYPLIDAGMRQLWQTGWMHNRVRMVVGSLLVKHLLHNWTDGEAWFWDTLFDACPANNTCGWQWIGGCGADAAPYFRIFNPMTQGDKFSAHDYVREFVPEIAHVEDKYLFNPWESANPPANYPAPIVDHRIGRERALTAFEKTKL